ncbi:hypothetical protein [Seonamhaeicola sp.]|uniref:hypothetical protein n=1 Tax=Seonamhaeicola sp. TaxID=1912245 RepID=UPI002630F3D0|nr:hypothetical protein [Seonamhaeicola sp.]
MKTLRTPFFLVLALILMITSCRTEEDLAIDPPTDEAITSNSTVAGLMKKTVLNDGSVDNIVYHANCFTFQLPITITVNSITITINEIGNYEDLEDILDEFEDDDDIIDISFPVTIVLADYTEIIINSFDELETYVDDCNDENEGDDDIECIDFQYPITASIFDENNDLINTISIDNDNDMYDFIEDLDDYAATTINFPITVIFPDDSTLVINDIQALEEAIELADDSCDEDDDYDYNDDDCDDCTTDDLVSVFADCPQWMVDELKRNNNDLEDNYEGYTFEFNNDGTIVVTQGSTSTFSGTWEASGEGNNISVTINIPDLSDFNGTWILHEIEHEPGEAAVELELGEDELGFESNC